MMKFIESKTVSEGQRALAERLKEALAAKQRVLWLVSGGSNLAIEAAVMRSIPAAASAGLAVLPADERYGQPGHKNSNMAQLLAAGFAPKKALVMPVLQAGLNLAATTDLYNQIVARALGAADVVIAQLGIGADGHIAGILPGSAAAKTSQQMVVSYKAADYQRISLTPAALKRVHEAFVFAFGAAKKAALTELRGQKLPLVTQPAQILRQIPRALVYNDQIGE